MATFVRELKCKLNSEEVSQRADKHAESVLSLDKLEAEKKALTSTLGEKIKVVRLEISDLARIVSDRAEYRSVDCYETPDFSGNRVLTIREDTGEQVETRPMRPEERQISLEWPKPRLVRVAQPDDKPIEPGPYKEDDTVSINGGPPVSLAAVEARLEERTATPAPTPAPGQIWETSAGATVQIEVLHGEQAIVLWDGTENRSDMMLTAFAEMRYLRTIPVPPPQSPPKKGKPRVTK